VKANGIVVAGLLVDMVEGVLVDLVHDDMVLAAGGASRTYARGRRPRDRAGPQAHTVDLSRRLIATCFEHVPLIL
jgi:hypothetical protein